MVLHRESFRDSVARCPFIKSDHDGVSLVLRVLLTLRCYARTTRLRSVEVTHSKNRTGDGREVRGIIRTAGAGVLVMEEEAI